MNSGGGSKGKAANEELFDDQAKEPTKKLEGNKKQCERSLTT